MKTGGTPLGYAQMKEYILNEFGLKVSSLYIAQVKKKCGIETGENHNLPKSEGAEQRSRGPLLSADRSGNEDCQTATGNT